MNKTSSHIMEDVIAVVSKMKGPYNYQDTAKNLDEISARTQKILEAKKKGRK